MNRLYASLAFYVLGVVALLYSVGPLAMVGVCLFIMAHNIEKHS